MPRRDPRRGSRPMQAPRPGRHAAGKQHAIRHAGAHRRRATPWRRHAFPISLAVTATIVVAGAQLVPPSPQRAAAAASRATIDTARAPASFATPRDQSALLERTEAVRADREQRPSRSGSRAPLPDWLARCEPRDSAQAHQNGELPAGELCQLPESGHRLHPDATRDWWRLNRKYRQKFGQPLCVTDSYRSYEAQSQLFGAKPGLAATPGTSNHGWGIAVDLCEGVEDFDSPAHQWLREHGPKFGWDNPVWAREGGSKPEPWHWEYDGDMQSTTGQDSAR